MNEWCKGVDTVWRFFATNRPDTVVAAIGKTGSMAIARALVDAGVKPERKPVEPGAPQVITAGEELTPPQLKPWDEGFRGKRVVVPVRDPVERFRSACVQMGVSPEEALEELDSGGPLARDYHFQPIGDYFEFPELHIVFFPEQVDLLCYLIGIDGLPTVNETRGPKPRLTDEQVLQVRGLYMKEASVWDTWMNSDSKNRQEAAL